MKKILTSLVLLALSASAQSQAVFNWLTFPVFGTVLAGNCVNWNTGNGSGVTPSVGDAGAPCGSGGGSSAFSALTGSTNTSAAMVVGTGASLTTTGSGTVTATNTTGVNGAAVPASAAVLASNSSSQLTSATVTGTGNVVLATSPTLTTPNLGTPSAATLTSATGLPITTGVSGLGTGMATFLATPSSANLAATVTNETGTGLLVFATSPALTTPNIGAATASALTLSAITGSTQCLHASTSGVVTGTGSDCGSGGTTAFSGLTSGTNTAMAALVGTGASLGPTGTGTVNANQLNGAAAPASALVVGTNGSNQLAAPSIANQTVLGNGGGSAAAPVALVLGGNLVATPTGLVTSQSVNPQTGTTYAMLAADSGKLLTFSNAAAVAVSLSQANVTGFTAGYSFDVQDLGVGSVTITPATSTINGAATLVIAQNTGCTVTSDGTNYQVSACTAVAPGGGGGSGTVNTGTFRQLAYYAASSNAVSSTAAASINAGALTLGASGTPGTLLLGNATSGLLTLQTGTGALGSAIATIPVGTDTLVELAATQTLTNKTLTAPTLTAPVLGTPASGTLTNATGLPVAGIAALAANTIVANATAGSATPTAVVTSALDLSVLKAVTTFTVTGTGCTPSAHTGTAFVGTITLATGPCSAVVVTPNGATGITATTGWHCTVSDRTTQAAGTWIPMWGESATTTTTVTLPVPAAAGATDVLSIGCDPY